MHRPAESTMWTITAVYAVGAVAAGTLLPRIERALLPDVLSPLTIPAAMSIYSSVASGMIALSGLVFSITFVMVQFSATAYSPRLVLWFARDRILSHAFGTFTATFLYAIAVLAWIGRGDSSGVPQISAAMVFVLLLASIAMFVALTNRVAMLQISRTLAFTGDQGRAVIDAVYPAYSCRAADLGGDRIDRADIAQVVVHRGPPLAVRTVDIAALATLAASADAVVEILVVVGDTVVESTPVLQVIGGRTSIDERQLRSAVELGLERTFEQDPKYAIRLLVDIAIRALSPAINDPTTAVQALDQISDLLLRLSRRRLETGAFRDTAGRVRVIIQFPAWDDFLWLSFGEIHAYGASSLQVMRRMHALVADLMAVVPDERRAALEYWQTRLRASVAVHFADAEERAVATREDRQGLGVTRRPLPDQQPVALPRTGT
jgi:uncharacterized membrane protein